MDVFCAYCRRNKATSKDHAPSKVLMEKPYPDNLLTIPACFSCNNGFSSDEEYLINVLCEISVSQTLIGKKQSGNVFRARNRSQKLRELIHESLLAADDGRIYFKTDFNPVKLIIEKIALGLFFHRYKKFARLEDFNFFGFYPFTVDELRPSDVILLTYTERFQSKKWTIMQKDIFSYIVVKDWRRCNKLTMVLNMHNVVWAVVEIPFPRQGFKSDSLNY